MGRDKTGYDCYGLVIECCRRAGTPIKDIHEVKYSLEPEKINDYISEGLNVRRIPEAKIGCIVMTEYERETHIGYLVERGLVIHTTVDKGVRLTPLLALRPNAYYEVIN